MTISGFDWMISLLMNSCMPYRLRSIDSSHCDQDSGCGSWPGAVPGAEAAPAASATGSYASCAEYASGPSPNSTTSVCWSFTTSLTTKFGSSSVPCLSLMLLGM